jgi:hypothetical protein
MSRATMSSQVKNATMKTPSSAALQELDEWAAHSLDAKIINGSAADSESFIET